MSPPEASGNEHQTAVFLFKTTHAVLEAEEKVIDAGIWCDVVPRPPAAADSLCGLAVEVRLADRQAVEKLLKKTGPDFEVFESKPNPGPDPVSVAENESSTATGGVRAGGDTSGMDRRLFVTLRTRWHARPLELAVILFSVTGNWGFFWVAAGLLLWLLGAAGRELAAAMILCVYLTLILNYSIKTALGRERPDHTEPELKPLVNVPTSKSFPSSHAAMSLAAAGVLTFFFPPLFPLFYLTALAMAWSRVYVGVHYPSDVLAGMAVGLSTGGIAALILSRI